MIQRLVDSRKRQNEGGFTLIELLVVIIILGILAAVVVFAVGGIGDKGQESACRIDERTLRTAEEAYAAQSVANGGGGGEYANQDTSDQPNDLVPGFLSEPPEYHTVTAINSAGADGIKGNADDVPASFTIAPADARCA